MKTFHPALTMARQNRRMTESAAAADARQERRRFYSGRKWRALSRQFLADHPICACGRLAAMVDHITPRRERPELAFDRRNLRSLCTTCHAEIGERFDTGG